MLETALMRTPNVTIACKIFERNEMILVDEV